MKKLNLIKKIKDSRKQRRVKKIQNKENKILLLKQIDKQLADITLSNLTLMTKPVKAKKLNKEEKNIYQSELKLYKIEKRLVKLKTAYHKKLEVNQPKLNELEKVKNAFAKALISMNQIKVETKDKAFEKQVEKINATLAQLEENPTFKPFEMSFLDSILSFMADLENSKNIVKPNTKDKNILKLANKIEKKLLEIQKSYKKQETKILASKQVSKYNEAYEKNVYKVKVKIAHLTHQTKVLNDVLWWMNLSKEEKKDRRSDLSFYVADILGYWLTLLSVVAEIVYLILLLSVMERTFWVGICILVNIAFLLLLFTVAIKVKNYKKTFSYISIVFGIYCVLRISYVIHGLMGVNLASISSVKLIFIYGANAYMILASILVGVRSYIKIKHQMIYLSENKITKFQLSK